MLSSYHLSVLANYFKSFLDQQRIQIWANTCSFHDCRLSQPSPNSSAKPCCCLFHWDQRALRLHPRVTAPGTTRAPGLTEGEKQTCDRKEIKIITAASHLFTLRVYLNFTYIILMDTNFIIKRSYTFGINAPYGNLHKRLCTIWEKNYLVLNLRIRLFQNTLSLLFWLLFWLVQSVFILFSQMD